MLKRLKFTLVFLGALFIPSFSVAEALIENPPYPQDRPSTFYASPAFFKHVKKQMIDDYQAELAQNEKAKELSQILPAAGGELQNSDLHDTDIEEILDLIDSFGLENSQ